MRKREFFLIGFLLIFTLTQVGCASFNRKLKSFLGGKSEPTEAQRLASSQTKFSETGDLSPRVRRQYKRTTKESLTDEAALDSKAGSLWVMEGQGAYLFSQNVVRLVGDPLAVTLDGDPRDQLNSKVSVIKRLIAKIEERQKARLRTPASDDEGDAKAKKDGKDKAGADAATQAQQQQQQQQRADAEAENLAIKNVPTRIVERTLDGNYRIKGSQPFMIANREYKVIVTGIVRSEDFNEEGISAEKLLDSKFDIVSARRKDGEM